MPDFPIVDAHVHLYDVKKLSYSWLVNVPKINRTYLLEDFDKARQQVAVEKIVFAEVAVDPGLHIEEAAFIQAMADKDSRLSGIIAHLPLEKGVGVESDIAPSRSKAMSLRDTITSSPALLCSCLEHQSTARDPADPF